RPLWYVGCGITMVQEVPKSLEQQGFVFDPYDSCVANKVVDNKKHTVCFHVNDLDNFEKWLNKMYGAHGEVKTTRGKVHDYLGMVFDFSQEGQVKVDLVDYISNMVEEFPMNLKPTDTAPTPASENLFAEGDGPKLDKDKAEFFHTFVAKGLFACKRARPDIHTAIALLCTRVKSPNQDDWNKLVRLIKYCNGTRQDKLILSTEDLHVIKWYVDSAFGVHPELKSHTGAVMTYGGGAAQSISRKQKLNTRSSTEAELVGADDAATMILWTKLFMEAQGHTIEKNILYQDNKSTILLENNGKRSSSKRTRAFNIRYFFLTYQVEKGSTALPLRYRAIICQNHFKENCSKNSRKQSWDIEFRPKDWSTGVCWRNLRKEERGKRRAHCSEIKAIQF
ncbi:MAG: Ty1/Copia family ribonuclease HI, partial [Rhizomicrobium sp.]